jgi:hypothetical protein
MRVGDKHLQLSSRRWRFITKTIEGNYPDWRAPIPNPADAKTVITLDPAKLETLIKLIQRMPCHDARHHTIGMVWKAGQFMLLGKEQSQDTWLRVPFGDTSGQGPDITVFLDRDYWVKGLSFGLNTLSLSSPVSPIRLHNEGKQLIIMPLRAEDSAPSTSGAHPPPSQVVTACPPQPPPSAEQTTPTTPMQTYPNPNSKTQNGTHSSSTSSDKNEMKTTLEAALLQVEGIKAGFRETMNQLSKIGDSIRAAMREQRANEKEIHGVRQTLRSLQSVRI